jgi:hypothetical protein
MGYALIDRQPRIVLCGIEESEPLDISHRAWMGEAASRGGRRRDRGMISVRESCRGKPVAYPGNESEAGREGNRSRGSG